MEPLSQEQMSYIRTDGRTTQTHNAPSTLRVGGIKRIFFPIFFSSYLDEFVLFLDGEHLLHSLHLLLESLEILLAHERLLRALGQLSRPLLDDHALHLLHVGGGALTDAQHPIPG